MYTVLIAEDEMLVRLGLKNSIDWARFDMNVVADAPDGQTAWELYQQVRPDLVVTDIRMPVMDGMELISRIREQDRATKIIILTCLEEFELARRAMSLGVNEYILKLTMSEKDIEGVLAKTQAELDATVKANSRQAQPEQTDMLAREQSVKGFLQTREGSGEDFASLIKRWKLKLAAGRLAVCLLEVDCFEAFAGSGEYKGETASLFNVISGQLDQKAAGEAFRDFGGRYILILNIPEAEDGSDWACGFVQELSSLLRTYFSVGVSAGISGVQAGFDGLPTLYRQTELALGQKFVLGSGCYSRNAPGIAQAFQSGMLKLKQIPALKELLGEQVYADFSARVDTIAGEGRPNREETVNALCRLQQWVAFQMYSFYQLDVSGHVLACSAELERCETLQECAACFEAFAAKLLDDARSAGSYGFEMAKAVNFLQASYTSQLTLNDVAKVVNMSPGYFSKLFKRDTGMNFVEYLNKLRLEKAEKLLIATDFKSYEIAEKTGFADNTYFCKVFKKATGVSPNGYRRQRALQQTEGSAHD